MAFPIIYLDHSDVRPGRLDELQVAFRELAEIVEREEPQLLTYAAYFDDDGTTSSVLHAHRDEASLRRHMQVIGPHLPPFAKLLRLREIEVYGEIGPDLTDQLEAKLALLGEEGLTVHRHAAGFLRPVAAPAS